MATSFLGTFVSEIRRQGVAKPNRYSVQILAPDCFRDPLPNPNLVPVKGRKVGLWSENAVLPTLNLNIATHRIYGPNYYYPLGVDYGGESITLTFIMDREMKNKKFFDQWMSYIVNTNSYNVRYKKGRSGYTTRIEILQQDEKDKTTYAIQLEDAFPRNIGIMNLDYGSLNSYHKLNVTFVYRRWKDITKLVQDEEYE